MQLQLILKKVKGQGHVGASRASVFGSFLRTRRFVGRAVTG
jgi:hypothetical protein